MTTPGLTLTPPTLPSPESWNGASKAAVTADDTGFSFHDLISIVNPLQHIPIVSTLYRAVTGDTIKPLERIAGDTLYGGWMGLASSVANFVFEKATGKDFGDTALAFVETGDLPSFAGGETKSGASPTTTAGSAPAAEQPVAAMASNEQLAAAARPLPSSALTMKMPVIKSGAEATRAPTPLPGAAQYRDPDIVALEVAMRAPNFDPELGRRALYAYRRFVGAPAAPVDLAPAS